MTLDIYIYDLVIQTIFMYKESKSTQFLSAIYYLFYTPALGGDEIQVSSMWVSALIIKGAESD